MNKQLKLGYKAAQLLLQLLLQSVSMRMMLGVSVCFKIYIYILHQFFFFFFSMASSNILYSILLDSTERG